MKNLLLSLFIYFVSIISVSAFDLDLNPQAGLVGKEMRIDLLPDTGEGPFTYAVKTTNIPDLEWHIEKNMFIWIPQKQGFYTATFVVIDSKNQFAEDSIPFSIIEKIIDPNKNPYNQLEKTVQTKVIPESVEEKKIAYLRKDQNKEIHLYQPISLYYTYGKFPSNVILEKYLQNIKLKCNKDTEVKRAEYFPYDKTIRPPQFVTKNYLESIYDVKVPEYAKRFVLFDLPKYVEVKTGLCKIYINDDNFNTYQIYYPSSKIFTKEEKFQSDNGIKVYKNSIIILSFKEEPVIKDDKQSVYYNSDNPYIKSLLSSPLSKEIKEKNIKNALTEEEMIALIIQTVTTVYDEKIASNKYQFPDYQLIKKYKNEASLFKKYGYDKGIRKELNPSLYASMTDLFFALSKPLGINVRWWESDTLKRDLYQRGIITKVDAMSNALTLERSASPIFYVQEVFTNRGNSLLNEKNPLILEAKRDKIIDEDIIYRSKKKSGVTRADFLLLLMKYQGKEYYAFEHYRKNYFLEGKKTVIYDDIDIENIVAPFVAYSYDRNYLPESWKGLEKLSADENVTRAEALEIIIRSQGKFDTAKNYYKNNIEYCLKKEKCGGRLFDLEENKKLGKEYFYAFYALDKEVIKKYVDRFGAKLNLFLPEKDVSLIDSIEWLKGIKNFGATSRI